MSPKKKIERLQFITGEKSQKMPAEQAELFCAGGGKWVQFRMKKYKDYYDLKSEALRVQAVCKRYAANLIINDHVHLAKEINADGVHLGKNDMPPAEARKILGAEKIIGGTANDKQTVFSLIQQGADYIGFGPFRFTKTKENLASLLGIEGYRDTMLDLQKQNQNIPVIAIGGITLEDIPDLFQTKIYGIAISSAISEATDSEQITLQFLNKIHTQCNL